MIQKFEYDHNGHVQIARGTYVPSRRSIDFRQEGHCQCFFPRTRRPLEQDVWKHFNGYLKIEIIKTRLRPTYSSCNLCQMLRSLFIFSLFSIIFHLVTLDKKVEETRCYLYVDWSSLGFITSVGHNW